MSELSFEVHSNFFPCKHDDSTLTYRTWEPLRTTGGPPAKAPGSGIMFKSVAHGLLAEGKEIEHFRRGFMCSNHHIGRERPQNKKDMNK